MCVCLSVCIQGSTAVFLEPWHADIEDFLDIRLNHGAEADRARDLFPALWVPDLFMKRVKADEKWTLFCPRECPGLDTNHNEKFDELYIKYESMPKKCRKVMKARELWKHILTVQEETGTPFICFKDAANRKNNQANLGTVSPREQNTGFEFLICWLVLLISIYLYTCFVLCS